MLVSLSANSSFPPTEGTFEFCDVVDSVEQNDGSRCPPVRGDVLITAVTYVPWLVPKGSLTVHIDAQTANKTRIACLNAVLEVLG